MLEKIEIEINLLEKIAKFYEFPMAVFCLPAETFVSKDKPTRFKELLKNQAEFKEKLLELIEEYL